MKKKVIEELEEAYMGRRWGVVRSCLNILDLAPKEDCDDAYLWGYTACILEYELYHLVKAGLPHRIRSQRGAEDPSDAGRGGI